MNFRKYVEKILQDIRGSARIQHVSSVIFKISKKKNLSSAINTK